MLAARSAGRFLRRRLSSGAMRRVALAFLAALATLVAGCSSHGSKTLGTISTAPAVSTAALRQVPADTPVVLHGRLTEKCPVAGCWFVLQDETGTVKVDTKHAGFVVLDVSLGTTVTVAGLVATNDTGRIIDATGLRY